MLIWWMSLLLLQKERRIPNKPLEKVIYWNFHFFSYKFPSISAFFIEPHQFLSGLSENHNPSQEQIQATSSNVCSQNNLEAVSGSSQPTLYFTVFYHCFLYLANTSEKNFKKSNINRIKIKKNFYSRSSLPVVVSLSSINEMITSQTPTSTSSRCTIATSSNQLPVLFLSLHL